MRQHLIELVVSVASFELKAPCVGEGTLYGCEHWVDSGGIRQFRTQDFDTSHFAGGAPYPFEDTVSESAQLALVGCCPLCVVSHFGYDTPCHGTVSLFSRDG